MELMASKEQNKPGSKTVAHSEELVDQFLDAIWMERGLSQNTLGAYRADLMTLGRGLAENEKTIEKADKAPYLICNKELLILIMHPFVSSILLNNFAICIECLSICKFTLFSSSSIISF